MYFFTTLAFGTVSLIVTGIVFKKTRKKLLLHFFFFYIPFTLIVIISTALVYIRLNVQPTIMDNILKPLRYVETLCVFSLVFTIPFFSHFLFEIKQKKMLNRFFGIIAIASYSVSTLFIYTFDFESLFQAAMYTGPLLLLIIVIYTLIIGLFQYKKMEAELNKKLAFKILLLLSFFLPALFHDLFPLFQSNLRLFPILYCSFSIILTYHILVHLQNYAVKTKKTSSKDSAADNDTFYSQWSLSPREIEVISLLLKGYGNREIADKLCISLSTVKTHLGSIYNKCKVDSRFELITLIKDNI